MAEHAGVVEVEGLCAALSSPIDQDGLLPTTWSLVGAVNATRPTAWARLPLRDLVTGPFDAASARRCLLGVLDPADELVPAERG
jgi:hypothetical protein